MPKWLVVILFVAGAALSWGVYVPMVHRAATGLNSNLRAFLFVGVAYFLVAVLVPMLMIFALNWDPTQGARPNFDALPVGWGIGAGTAGAVGALCVIFAAKAAGGPLYVAPLVFAGAPIINTFATLVYFHPVRTAPDWKFFLGLVMAAAGMVMVMVFKPSDAPAKPPGAPATAPADPGSSAGH